MADLADVAAKVAAEVAEESAEKAPERPAAKPAKVVAQVEAEAEDEPVEAAPSPAEQARQKAEADARAKGWRPKAEWEGDPEDWVSAKVFIKRGEEIEERQSWKKQLKGLEAQNKELAAILRSKLDNDAKKDAQVLLAKRDAAIEVGDKAEVHKIEAELSKVGAPQEPWTPLPEIQEWQQKHSEWWDLDPLATQAAALYYSNLVKKDGDLKSVPGHLDKTEKYVRKRFPDLFPEDQARVVEAVQAHAQQTRKLSTVSIPSGDGAPAKGKSWSDLPAEAKRVGEKFVRDGLMKREEYVKSFFERQG